jgi:hypothetical protein
MKKKIFGVLGIVALVPALAMLIFYITPFFRAQSAKQLRNFIIKNGIFYDFDGCYGLKVLKYETQLAANVELREYACIEIVHEQGVVIAAGGRLMFVIERWEKNSEKKETKIYQNLLHDINCDGIVDSVSNRIVIEPDNGGVDIEYLGVDQNDSQRLFDKTIASFIQRVQSGCPTK